METLSHMRQRRLIRGFSLTEVAIVLGVVGIILGSIWAYAGSMSDKVKQDRFSQLLTTIIGNIRGNYAGMANFETTRVDSVDSGMMPILTDRGIFPAETVQRKGTVSVVISPFGEFENPRLNTEYKSLYVCGWKSKLSSSCDFGSGTENVPLFAIEALLPEGNACVVGVLRNSNAVSFPGLTAVYINDVQQTLPLTLNAAKNACNKSVNYVDFVFRLTL